MSKIIKKQYVWNGELIPFDMNYVDGIIIHHPAHPTWDAIDIHLYHRDTKGWKGGGYNWFIQRNGHIITMRGHHEGGHASGYNEKKIGVCFQGDFHRGSQVPTAQQYESFGWLMRNELIPKYRKVTKDTVLAHFDVGNTSCPGIRFDMQRAKDSIKESKTEKGVTNMAFLTNDSLYGVCDSCVSDGEGAKAVQSVLIDLGEDLKRYGADGSIGDETINAIKSFQTSNGLTADGIVGKSTKKVMKDLIEKAEKEEAERREKENGQVYRVIVDGKQVGAYGQYTNVAREIEKAMNDSKKTVKIEKV